MHVFASHVLLILLVVVAFLLAFLFSFVLRAFLSFFAISFFTFVLLVVSFSAPAGCFSCVLFARLCFHYFFVVLLAESLRSLFDKSACFDH